jgi:hypothetical protein
MGPDALDTIVNEFESAKHEKWTRRPRYRRKCVRARKILKRDPNPSVPWTTNSGAQNIKMRTDALGTAENESGSAKHEIEIRRPRYRRKRARDRKT